MMFAGLKKCMPSTFSGRLVTSAIPSTSSVEVFVASTAGGLQTAVELAEHILFHRHVFEDGLDDEIGLRRSPLDRRTG